MRANFVSRRGAVLPLVAFVMVVIGLLAAVVTDFSRAYAQKNELQTAADAAALAGVIELFRDPDAVGTKANTYSGFNEVLFRSLSADNSEYDCGVWDPASATFDASSTCSTADNAVEFTLRDIANFIFPDLVGLAGTPVSATAIAWMSFVDVAPCVRPWAIAYEKLTRTLDPDGDPDRDLSAEDIERLQTWDRSQLRFMLRWTGDSLEDPGNFGSLNLSGTTGGGATAYERNIWDCSRRPIGRDTVLYTQSGGMSGPTMQGIMGESCEEGEEECEEHPGLCPVMVGRECRNEDGVMGVTIIAALWGYMEKSTGTFPVTVRQLVSFKLDSAWREKGKPIIVGHFVPATTTGSVTPMHSTIRRPILVR